MRHRLGAIKELLKGLEMAFNIQFITHPGRDVIEILMTRMSAVAKKSVQLISFNAVGLIQGRVVDMVAAADVAEKAAKVHVYDLKGLCPQHLTMIGIFGEIADVRAALDAIQAEEGLG